MCELPAAEARFGIYLWRVRLGELTKPSITSISDECVFFSGRKEANDLYFFADPLIKAMAGIAPQAPRKPFLLGFAVADDPHPNPPHRHGCAASPLHPAAPFRCPVHDALDACWTASISFPSESDSPRSSAVSPTTRRFTRPTSMVSTSPQPVRASSLIVHSMASFPTHPYGRLFMPQNNPTSLFPLPSIKKT